MGKITYKYLGDRDLNDAIFVLSGGSAVYPGEECRELSPDEAQEAVAFAVRFIAGIKWRKKK